MFCGKTIVPVGMTGLQFSFNFTIRNKKMGGKKMKKRAAITMKVQDNVATAVESLAAGTNVTFSVGEQERHLTVKQDIPFGHKFAIRNIVKGEEIIKYGSPIGAAERSIEAGEHVHVHNIGGIRGRGDLPH